MRHGIFKIFVFLSLLFLFTYNSWANVVLKVMAINPSQEQTQKVPLKAYLPKEVKPEDIAEKGDLEIAYDTQQGSYYVYGEYELKPGETLEREIEIRDIWAIPDSELESLRLESIKLADLLKNTEFAERVSFLKNNIDSKLNQIGESQRSAPANPEQRISDFRDNLKILESVKADLSLARSLLSQAKPLPTVIVWRLIIAIIIFLGVLAASFFFIWQKQAKVIIDETQSQTTKEEHFAGTGKSDSGKDVEKGIDPNDIEDIEKLLGDDDSESKT